MCVFVEGGEKLERLRDLFEQAIEDAPAKEATILYLMYAQTEEKYAFFVVIFFVQHVSFETKTSFYCVMCQN